MHLSIWLLYSCLAYNILKCNLNIDVGRYPRPASLRLFMVVPASFRTPILGSLGTGIRDIWWLEFRAIGKMLAYTKSKYLESGGKGNLGWPVLLGVRHLGFPWWCLGTLQCFPSDLEPCTWEVCTRPLVLSPNSWAILLRIRIVRTWAGRWP